MANITTIAGEARTAFGKGAARKIRRADKIPAVIYGHGEAPVHVTLPGHETMLATRQANALLSIKLPDDEHLVLVKDVQRDAVSRLIEHVDLLVVRRGEKVEVEVPVHLVGEPIGGTVAETDLTEVLINVDATNIPERIEVPIEGADEGTHVYAKDLALPEGAELITDPEALIVAVIIPSAHDLGDTADELAVEAAEAEAAADAAAAGTEAGGEQA